MTDGLFRELAQGLEKISKAHSFGGYLVQELR